MSLGLSNSWFLFIFLIVEKVVLLRQPVLKLDFVHLFASKLFSLTFKKDSCFLRQMLLQSFLYANNVSFRHFTQK